MTRRRIFLNLALIVIGPLLVIAAYILFIQASSNFHALIPGELYRAAQPSADEVSQYAEHYGIKTIINLRGENYNKAWYRDMRAAAAFHNVHVLEFPLSTKREVTPEQMQALVVMMRDAPKPLLIHCRSGANRTGLASALYLRALKHASEFEVKTQLSFLYGHLSSPFMDVTAMDRSLAAFQPVAGSPVANSTVLSQ